MAGKPTYRISEWDKHYEVAQTRKVSGGLNWVAIPTKHDGKGYRRLMRRPDGPSVFAAWVLIVQVAAKCPERGVLADSKGPLDADDLCDKTDCPAEVFRNALKVLSHPSIGWLDHSATPTPDARSGSGVGVEWECGIPQTNKQDKQTNQEPIPILPPNPPHGGKVSKKRKGWSQDEVEEAKAVIAAWNETPGVVPAQVPLEASRKRQLRTRVRDPKWRAGWREAVAMIAESDYCTGKINGWQASFDWFLKPAVLHRVLEGQYANKGHPPRGGGTRGGRFEFLRGLAEAGDGDDGKADGAPDGLPRLGDG